MADYYKILGVSRDSTNPDIKKSYRKLALRWHPDKNPDSKDEAERRFKEISEAYRALSDQTKPHQYERESKGDAKKSKGGKKGSMNSNSRRSDTTNSKRKSRSKWRNNFRNKRTNFSANQSEFIYTYPRTELYVKYVNGKRVRVETIKVVNNGVETITTTEDGVLTSKLVNGVQQY